VRQQPRLYRGLAALAALVAVGGAGAAAPTSGLPTFSHAVVIVFENKESGQVIGSPAAPTFNRLAKRYALLARYTGVAHPSLPNYLALVSGSTHGIRADCTACVVRGPSLEDTLSAAGKTWKTYAEGLPRPGFQGAGAGRYAKKHVPFLYFRDVLADGKERRRVVPLSRFARDLASGSLPDFALVVPNLCHDMHDCPVKTGDAWLGKFLPPLLADAQLRRGVVFVVFDEGSSSVGGGGRVPALALGPLVRPGSVVTAPTSHYTLLRTIEDSWGLPRLGRSAATPPITGIWR
jgi:phosphatidylinositol-3-phosphatase